VVDDFTMRTVAFLSQKGGSGKTTLAVHIAVAAQEDGERVVIVDTDLQKSAATWSEARASATPAVAPVATAALNDVMAAARHDAITLCIIDTAPHAAPDAARVARAADLVLIPCRPTAFDLAAAGSAVDIARAAEVSAAFILSACPFRAPEIVETRAVLTARYGLPVAPIDVTDRRAFARAIATGRAVTEFDSHGKAAEEVRSLWRWIKEQIINGRKGDRTSRVHAEETATS
jgi:chromosome partitioning protein